MFFLFVALLYATASVPDKKIVVKGSDGCAEYAVADIQSIKFSNGNVQLGMKDGSVATWVAESISVMSFLYYEPSQETGIDETAIYPFSMSAGALVVEVSSTAVVSLSTIDGKQLFNGSCNGELRLPLCKYPAGIYLLVINGRTYKLMLR